MDEVTKVTILLHEYDTLRAELLSRYAAQFQAIGVIAAVLAALVAAWAAGLNIRVSLSLAIETFLIFIAVMVWADYDISRTSLRVRELEADINSRAGEELLVWETKFGGGGGPGRLFMKSPSPKPK